MTLKQRRQIVFLFVACKYGCGTEEELKMADYSINEPRELLDILNEIEKILKN